MKLDILDAATLGDDLDLSLFEEFGDLTIHQAADPESLPGLLAETQVVITNKLVFTRELMKQLPKLKLICLTATGYNNVDHPAAEELGIALCNVAGYSTGSVAQHTFSLLLSLLEQIPWYDHFVKSGEYQKAPVFTNISRPWFELSGKKWGIIGLGNIGRRVAALAEAFGCRVSYYSTSGTAREEAWPSVPLDQLLAESHVVSVHAPLNEKTRNLMNYDRFCKMRRDAFFLNLGRGPIVDDTGLCKALEEDRIAGAGLDVFSREPIEPENPLLQIACPDKLILTPHNAWGSIEARTLLMREIAENIRAFEQGTKRNRIV